MSNQESFSVIAAARLLGVSRWTVGRLVRTGKLTAFRVAGCTRIHLGELKRYKLAQTIAADGADGSRR